MKKRIFTLALVVLFVLTLLPLVAVANEARHELPAPTVDDFGDHDHWGWSYENGSLPGLRNATGIIIEFDTEPGQESLSSNLRSTGGITPEQQRLAATHSKSCLKNSLMNGKNMQYKIVYT